MNLRESRRFLIYITSFVLWFSMGTLCRASPVESDAVDLVTLPSDTDHGEPLIAARQLSTVSPAVTNTTSTGNITGASNETAQLDTIPTTTDTVITERTFFTLPSESFSFIPSKPPRGTLEGDYYWDVITTPLPKNPRGEGTSMTSLHPVMLIFVFTATVKM